MEIKKCKSIYFSLTDTTKKVVDSIVRGLDTKEVEVLNLNKSVLSKEEAIVIDSDIVVIGVPVYGGRIVKKAQDALEKIDGRGKLAILVAVYGNISPGLAIEQLYDICTRKNLKVVGIGTFIGEHSFSTEEAKVGYKRPNEDDIIMAQEFGQRVRQKLIDNSNETDFIVKPKFIKIYIAKVINKIYKIMPQKSGNVVTDVPIINKELCNKCGLCVKNCPVNAISNDENLSIDNKKCIRCFRCVKKCSKEARKINYRLRPLVSSVLNFAGGKPKENKIKL